VLVSTELFLRQMGCRLRVRAGAGQQLTTISRALSFCSLIQPRSAQGAGSLLADRAAQLGRIRGRCGVAGLRSRIRREVIPVAGWWTLSLHCDRNGTARSVSTRCPCRLISRMITPFIKRELTGQGAHFGTDQHPPSGDYPTGRGHLGPAGVKCRAGAHRRSRRPSRLALRRIFHRQHP